MHPGGPSATEGGRYSSGSKALSDSIWGAKSRYVGRFGANSALSAIPGVISPYRPVSEAVAVGGREQWCSTCSRTSRKRELIRSPGFPGALAKTFHEKSPRVVTLEEVQRYENRTNTYNFE